MIDLSLNEHVLPLTDFRFSKWANMLACCHGKLLAAIVQKTNPTNRKKAIQKRPKTSQIFPKRNESDGECSDGGESPEKRLVGLKVMPVCEIRKESAEGVVESHLPNVVETMEGVSHDECQIIVSHLLGESSEALDDSGLRQLIENVPKLDGEQSCAVDRGVSVGQITESVTFWTM